MPVEEFVAGWISGALGLVMGYPFDTLKVRLQTQNTYRGITDCMAKIYHHESILGFFKGMSFPIASIALVNSILFGVYSNTLQVLTATSHQDQRAQLPSYTHIFIAGCTGGFLQASSVLSNVEALPPAKSESRVQPGSPPPKYRGPVHCAATIFQEEGPRGLFRGSGALMLRDTPTLGFYFVTYEGLCHQYTPAGQQPSSTTVLVAGGFAGIASWVTATPFDVIKARMQMGGVNQRAYKGMLDCIVTSFWQEGLGVFFRGFTINSARAFPVNAVTFLCYEYLLRVWGYSHRPPGCRCPSLPLNSTLFPASSPSFSRSCFPVLSWPSDYSAASQTAAPPSLLLASSAEKRGKGYAWPLDATYYSTLQPGFGLPSASDFKDVPEIEGASEDP
ncbi:Solute carrier family 25 member 45 [Fukomys damarensis]|uniref:Solute carrier family 25 member 45 n=1 Tax=Fukomys damarensis TaxID=885580 RepID=A0A091E008_FUKDA|nr:Solute carrier family 25 member 45 [Fukomys damarensis]